MQDREVFQRALGLELAECGRGVEQAEVPWARPDSGSILLFEVFVMALAKEMSVAAAVRLVGSTRL